MPSPMTPQHPRLLAPEVTSIVRVALPGILSVFGIGAEWAASARKCISRGDDRFRRNAFLVQFTTAPSMSNWSSAGPPPQWRIPGTRNIRLHSATLSAPPLVEASDL